MKITKENARTINMTKGGALYRTSLTINDIQKRVDISDKGFDMTIRDHTIKMITTQIDMKIKEYLYKKGVDEVDTNRFKLIQIDSHLNDGYTVYIYDEEESETTKIIEVRHGESLI